MYDALSSEALTSNELWACFAALRALDDALGELTVAAQEARQLAADAAWDVSQQGRGPAEVRRVLAVHGDNVPVYADRVRALRAGVAAMVA